MMSSGVTHRLVTTPVRGGDLTAGVWNEGGGEPVLAFHGVTASHMSWLAVARALAPRTVIAPDLRGRGGSRDLPAPFGMAQHAEDALALLDRHGIEKVDVVGHSMGGFVAMRFAANFPERVRSVTLVDGGIPLPLPAGVPIAEVMRQALGPALARLEMTYPTRESYREFWRAHPAFANDWSPEVEEYVDYDLVGAEPELRASASGVAVLADAVEQGIGTIAEQPWAALAAPTVFLRAPRGMMDGPEGLYAAEYVADWAASHPALTVIDVPEVNHYTIVMSPRGTDAVVAAIRNQRR
ncbi:MAG: lipase [Actinomycetota bacterium]|nr:lipase [Actinomycetota bacterium]MDQ1574529.1 lipase [Actinomycetota bacterium]